MTHCCSRACGTVAESTRADISDLKLTVKRLQDDIIDLVDKLDKSKCESKASSDPQDPPTTTAQKPQFRNPQNIPNYDAIEVVAEVETHPNILDESVVSMDEFVPHISAEVITENPLN